MRRLPLLAAGFLAALCVAAPALATLTIQVNYTGDSQYAGFFSAAAAKWESILTGYRDGYSNTVTIDASVGFIDMQGGTLAQAGPTSIALVGASSSPNGTNDAYAVEGIMNFDEDDIGNLVSNQTFGSVILHEMAHVLGFGTLWNFVPDSGAFAGTTFNDVYDSANFEFTGAAATAEWQSEFGQSGTPDVEQGGGPGTADGHWNEVDGGFPLTGITDPEGRDMRNELMTGWIGSNMFISRMTVASFQDIGFTVNFAAIPEPATTLVFGLVATGLTFSGRRSG